MKQRAEEKEAVSLPVVQHGRSLPSLLGVQAFPVSTQAQVIRVTEFSALTAGDGNSDGLLYLQARWPGSTYKSSESFITFLSIQPLLTPKPWLPIHSLQDFSPVFKMFLLFFFAFSSSYSDVYELLT